MLAREVLQEREEDDAFAGLSALKAQQYENPDGQVKVIGQSQSAETAQITAQSGDNADEHKNDTIIKEKTGQHAGDGADAHTPLQQYLPLYEINPEFFGWIKIEDTNIDYPVVYSPDRPNFYINHNFYGKDAYNGVPYLDEECDPDGPYYLLYGHNPNWGTMFSHIIDYEKKSFWEKHQLIQFDTLYEERTYVVVAAIKARVLEKDDKDEFRYYNYKIIDTEPVFYEYADQVKRFALYDTGIGLSFGDELLVLSTCYHYVKNGRFVVIAKRIS